MPVITYKGDDNFTVESMADVYEDALNSVYEAVATYYDIDLTEAKDLVDAQLSVGDITQEGKQWFKAHPNAILLFELSMAEIDAKVAAWDLSSIPNPARNEIKLTIRALIASIRILAHQLDLID